ncbi:MAG TPA: L-2-hydroxyglutarate oxidase [Cyclobacteriaceae bacterium]|nr:L-2-hydroxyglutarate oxidase [Cyclobacteriaceae bacterium]
MQYDVLIVGGGVVGLATGLQLLSANPALKVAILEKEDRVGRHQTGNNSGVIHSGLYYKPGSLKALNCIRGYNMLVDFCQRHNIPYELCGKIIIATEERELPMLQTLYERGLQNGLKPLTMLSAEQIREYEPHAAGIRGILVPQTGIVDFRVVAQKYAEVFEQSGGSLFLGEKVKRVDINQSVAHVATQSKTYDARLVVNCAGLYSDKIARLTSKGINVKIVPFRGEYYKLRKDKEYLVKNLIYPVPDPAFPFLGVHFTRMARGGVEAGPNAVLAFSREGYRKTDINLAELGETLAWPGFRKVAAKYWRTGLGEMYRSFSKAAFTRALQKMVPEIQEDDLVEGGAGVRAQACDRTGGLVDDFMIIEEPRVINVCNAPSPAATSSLSIGLTVSELARKRLF